ncbi:MAG: M14 family zinc carboxypeptidase [Thermodesulfobacteriota bacterium]|nr:M14 family zinc carboxypeptidase [Thermodesulfobacteriota bacterium]
MPTTKSSLWPPKFDGKFAMLADSMRGETIGRSEENRPLTATLMGSPKAHTRILVMAGQHGDEQTAIRSVKHLVAMNGTQWIAGGNLQIAILADANPDGAARRTRLNAGGIDLNRDHQLLLAAETTVLHGFIRDWLPHLIVDVHNYPPRRKHLLRQNLIYCQDLFVDIPTNPNLINGPFGRLTQDLLQTVVSAINHSGYRCERYTLINSSGRVRHSTPNVNDARNSLALRYGIPTVLLEGRQPTRRDRPAMRERLQTALQTAIFVILTWAEGNHERLKAAKIPIESAVLHSRYLTDAHGRKLAFKVLPSGNIHRVALPGKYTPHLKVTQQVDLPHAYAVPAALTNLCNILIRHGLSYHMANRGESVPIQSYQLTAVEPSRRPNRMPRRLTIERVEEKRSLDNYFIFPVTPGVGAALAVFLEPQSKYGLHRYSETGLTLTSNTVYPVLRIIQENSCRDNSWRF